MLTFIGDGLVINLPWQQAAHENSSFVRIFKFFNGCQFEFSMIRLIIIDPVWPIWSCQSTKVFK